MKKILFGTLIWILFITMACNQTNFDAENPLTYPVYEGTDLGVNYSANSTDVKIWAPTAEKVTFRLYNTGEGGTPLETIMLKKIENGSWYTHISTDILGKFYTFQVLIKDKWHNEVPGPDAKAVGVNGRRGMVVDLAATNPVGWDADKRPTLASPTDMVIYELHVRDFSIHPNSGITHKGKYLAFTESGTQQSNGITTGIDHLVDLGITHVHILPSFDFRSVDETRLTDSQYNWGYDPQNYNVPEGSYATDPYDGNVRINEFKQMVQALHKKGIRVILDVVYNHVGNPEEQSFEQIVPNYYFRKNTDGSWSNASGCGNETASEHLMMRKYIIESVKYWASEYHIDGFRFDLMGIHDIETMNQIATELNKIDSTIFIYGEGWTAGDSPLPISQRAIKENMPKVKGVAAFSDEMRDGIKGHWNNIETKGFVSGEPDTEESVKFGIVAATQHPQVDYAAVNYSQLAWSNAPSQTINYVSCHDNNTLWDKLAISAPESTILQRKRMAKLANTIVLTSQGVPFLHSGVEFLRTKQKVENSYNAPDSINWIDWNLRTQNADMVDFYKGLIKMRKEHPAFRMIHAETIASHLEFMDLEPGMVGYSIVGNANSDVWSEIVVVFNANPQKVDFYFDEQYTEAFNFEKGYHTNGKTVKGNFVLDGISAYVFYK